MLHRINGAMHHQFGTHTTGDESHEHQEDDRPAPEPADRAVCRDAGPDGPCQSNRREGCRATIEEQIGLFETAVDSARPLAAAKLPEDVFSVQLDAWKTLSEKMVVAAGKIAEIQRETGAELKDIVIDGFKTVNDTIPKAA